MLARDLGLVVHGFVRVRGQGAKGGSESFQAVGSANDGGDRAAVESLGQ